MVSFLQRCNISYGLIDTYSIPKDFSDACIAKAKLLNLNMEGPDSIAPYMIVGVAIGYLSYKHINNIDLEVHIALFTATVTYLDDNLEKHVDSLSQFAKRFTNSEAQADLPTKSLDKILRETSNFYDGICKNMLISSTFNFITALILQYKLQGAPVRTIY